jgi:hypothetical protein
VIGRTSGKTVGVDGVLLGPKSRPFFGKAENRPIFNKRRLRLTARALPLEQSEIRGLAADWL